MHIDSVKGTYTERNTHTHTRIHTFDTHGSHKCNNNEEEEKKKNVTQVKPSIASFRVTKVLSSDLLSSNENMRSTWRYFGKSVTFIFAISKTVLFSLSNLYTLPEWRLSQVELPFTFVMTK